MEPRSQDANQLAFLHPAGRKSRFRRDPCVLLASSPPLQRFPCFAFERSAGSPLPLALLTGRQRSGTQHHHSAGNLARFG